MNYLKHYCNLIRKAENRVPPEDYTEKHHTFPKSIFGDNKRIIVLTAREHYIAHALLEKICIKRYGLKNQKTQKMITAFWCMNNQKTKNEYLNSYLYEYSRIRFIESIRGRELTEEHKMSIVEELKTRVWWTDGINTKHCKECPGEGWYRGRPNINLGRVLSGETRQKIREKNSGKKLTEEHKEKLRQDSSSRRWWNNGTKDKFSKECPGRGWILGRLYKRELSEEEIENIRTRMKNRVISEETRKKQGDSRRGKKLTDEQKKKIGETSKRLGLKPPSTKGKKWWNNGLIEKLCFECPGDGWVRGRGPVVKVS